MKYVLIALTLALTGCMSITENKHDLTALTNATAEASIVSVLETQNVAWNNGDIDAFMEGYWKNEQLRFGSSGNITRGWQATLDRYKRVYNDRAAMGQLTFSDLDVQVLASDAAVVHGRWALERQNDTPGGLFTLIFRNFGNGWVIVSDTTTSGTAG